MNDLEKQGYVFGSIFVMANKLQVLGDKMDPLVTIKQWLFIAAILKANVESLTLSEVAKLVGYSRQNVKKTALLLEKLGFVSLVKDENDERALNVKLTDYCIEYFNNRDELELKFISDLFNGFDQNLIDGLFNGLKKLEEYIYKMEKVNEE